MPAGCDSILRAGCASHREQTRGGACPATYITETSVTKWSAGGVTLEGELAAAASELPELLGPHAKNDSRTISKRIAPKTCVRPDCRFTSITSAGLNSSGSIL